MKRPALLTDNDIVGDYKQLWKCLTGDHSKCNSGCPGKSGGQKKAKPLIRIDRLREYRTQKKKGKGGDQVRDMPEQLYKRLFEEFLLSPKMIEDIKNSAAGSHIEAMHLGCPLRISNF